MKQIICIFLWLVLSHFPIKILTACAKGLHLNICGSRSEGYTNTGNVDHSEKKNYDQEVTHCPVKESHCNSISFASKQINLGLIDINYLNCHFLESKGTQFNNDSALSTSVTQNDEADTLKNSSQNCGTVYTKLVESKVIKTENWKIINMNPVESQIDTEIQSELQIQGKELPSNDVRCFVQSPDHDVEILSVASSSENQIKCESFVPVVPGFYTIGVIIYENIYLVIENNTFKVSANSPVAEKAEYTPDFQSILIYFDQNVELLPDCSKSFSKETQEHFGSSSTCIVQANILKVKMGFDYKPISMLEIVPDNNIFRAGTKNFSFSSCALPVTLPVSDRKVLSPNLSIYLENDDCSTSEGEKHLSVKVTPLENQKLYNSYKMSSTNGKRKSQRENLIIWRTIREIQRRLTSRIILKPSEVLPKFEDIVSVGNFLENEERATRSPTTPTAVVSVVIVSTPTPSTILAEANVTFCNDTFPLYRYKWTVNEEIVSEDGKLLLVNDLSPGKYTIKCFIIDNNSSEILGQGWVTTQIVARVEEVIIFPSEIVVGSMDDVVLHAITQQRKSISWICKTSLNKPCFTKPPQGVDFNSPLLSIPAGTLSTGSYIWTVDGAQEWSFARIIVKKGDFPVVSVKLASVFISSVQNLTLKGVVKRFQAGCRILWSSVRHKGFDYFNLEDVSIYEEEDKSEKNVSLIIPSSINQTKSLKPYSLYMFKLQAICPHSDSFSHIKIPVSVNEPPQVSPVRVEPQTGNSLITQFQISGAEANDSVEDQPLLFEWSYSEPCDTIIPIRRGAYSTSFTAFLPPGDLQVTVKVCNVRKTCTIASSSIITVYQVGDVPPENFENVRSRIQYLMTSGDFLEAFGLAITAFKALALTAESEIRQKLFSTLEEGIENRMRELTERLKNDSKKAAELSLEFCQQAMPCLKYFRKGSDIVEKIKYFKNGILEQMKARSDFKESQGFN